MFKPAAWTITKQRNWTRTTLIIALILWLPATFVMVAQTC